MRSILERSGTPSAILLRSFSASPEMHRACRQKGLGGVGADGCAERHQVDVEVLPEVDGLPGGVVEAWWAEVEADHDVLRLALLDADERHGESGRVQRVHPLGVHNLGVLRLGRVSQREGVRGADVLRLEVVVVCAADVDGLLGLAPPVREEVGRREHVHARLGVDASSIRSRHVHTGGRVVRVDDLDMPDKRVCLHRVHARHVHGEHDARVREDERDRLGHVDVIHRAEHVARDLAVDRLERVLLDGVLCSAT